MSAMSDAADAGDNAAALDRLRPGSVMLLPSTVCGDDEVLAYADLMKAHHPIHVDEAFAKASRFGGRIAHGPLALGLALGALGEVLGPSLVALLEITRWTFLQPVLVGAVLRTQACVLRVDRAGRDSGRVLEIEIRLLGDDGVVLQRGEVRVLVGSPPRGAAATA